MDLNSLQKRLLVALYHTNENSFLNKVNELMMQLCMCQGDVSMLGMCPKKVQWILISRTWTDLLALPSKSLFNG